MEKIILYSFRRCPFAMRVRMTLWEKEIPFETREEDLKNKSPELLKIHPQGKVPVLLYGKDILYESSVLTEFVNALKGSPALVPEDPLKKAHVRLWTLWCDQTFKPLIDQYKYKFPTLSEEERRHVCEQLDSQLSRLDSSLSQQPWLMGEQFTLADIHVFPFFRQLARATPEYPHLSCYPFAQQWLETITNRPTFKKTMAP